MKANMVIALVAAAMKNDRHQVRTLAIQIEAEERRAGHTQSAQQIAKVLEAAGAGRTKRVLPAHKGAAQLDEITPPKTLEEMVLQPEVREGASQIIAEQRAQAMLEEAGLTPRHTVLLVGPPGNGKTCLAGAIAHALDRPLLMVRYEHTVGSFLGETGARMAKVFDYVANEQCVLLIDEIDAIARSRSDRNETGEMKRVVNMLLMQMDRLPAHVLLVATTNQPGAIDHAAWRRWQVRLTLERPHAKAIGDFARGRLAEVLRGGQAPGCIARVAPESLAEAEELALDLARRTIMAGKKTLNSAIVTDVERAWEARRRAKTKDETNTG